METKEISDNKLDKVAGGMLRGGEDTCPRGRTKPDAEVCSKCGCENWVYLAGRFGGWFWGCVLYTTE